MAYLNKLKKKYLIIPLILVVISAIVLLVGNVLVKPTGSKLYLDFMKDLSNSKVSTVYVTNSSKIKVQLKRSGLLEKAILENEEYIKSETLTSDLIFVDELENGIEIEFDEIKTKITIIK